MRILTGKRPWYDAGLAFECIRCGRCCAGPEEGYVWVTTDEIAAIARHLGTAENEMQPRYVRKVGKRYSLIEREDNKDCIFLTADDRGNRVCRIYPVRPRQCRAWPFWSSNLSSPDAWARMQLRCPGVNRGRVHSYDEIEATRKGTSE